MFRYGKKRTNDQSVKQQHYLETLLQKRFMLV